MTAAPFCDSMYQPFSVKPSLVSNATFSYGAPRSAVGTSARADMGDDVGDAPAGSSTTDATNSAPPVISSRRGYRHQSGSSVRRDFHSATTPTPISTKPAGADSRLV